MANHSAAVQTQPTPASREAGPPTLAAAWTALLLYFAVQLMSRLLVSEAVELDEAQQLVWTQQLSLGYGTQPPLYSWLQWAAFQLFGVSLFALALLKNLLLAATYVFTFLAARLALPQRPALLAAASMLLLPQLGWEAQRDLTHSVLVTAMAAATLWLALRLVLRAPAQRRAADYAWLGVALAAGSLGKYSFVFFAAALGGALLLGRDTRGALLDRRLMLTLLAAALLCAPHALWLASHFGDASAGSIGKMEVAGSGLQSRAAAAWKGLASLLRAVLAFLTPLWIVLGLLLVGVGSGSGGDADAAPSAAVITAAGPAPSAAVITATLLRRYLALLALAFVLLVLVGGATRFKDRWMLPLLFMAPLIFFVHAPALWASPRLRWLGRIIAGWALLIIVLLAARVPYNGWRGNPDELNLPTAALAAQLRGAGYDGVAPIVTASEVLGGALRLQFPRARVQVVYEEGLPPQLEPPCLLIAEGTQPSRLAALAPQLAQPGAVRTVSLPYRLAGPAAAQAGFVWAMLR